MAGGEISLTGKSCTTTGGTLAFGGSSAFGSGGLRPEIAAALPKICRDPNALRFLAELFDPHKSLSTRRQALRQAMEMQAADKTIKQSDFSAYYNTFYEICIKAGI